MSHLSSGPTTLFDSPGVLQSTLFSKYRGSVDDNDRIGNVRQIADLPAGRL